MTRVQSVRSGAGRVVAAAGAALLLVSGCGGDEDAAGGREDASASPTEEVEEPESTPAGDGAPADDAPGTEWGTDVVHGDGDGDGAAGPSELAEVTVTEDDGFDRVALEFTGAVPDHITTYMDPLAHGGLGTPVELAGDQALKVVLVGMVEETVNVASEPTALVPEVRGLGIFEGELGVGLGIESPAGEPLPYRVSTEDQRIVVDIAHAEP
ncbi:hypothetical protein RM844_10260 [Streptomyces sp. DSM 44915]|uniref:AMIN-like domain-containing protein n=1 Tax=Streptomyces chisholmiae TaxID=3075540 RepID=A0ABU2JNW9_9ACTN|nr:hypothetical protein [Streptomyces sp. DSM 44915]MDT0266675.1 hypothetical protein [Streptomyces sp. DSM 44915]